MYCGKCGTDNAADLSYCVSCGAHLDSQRAPSAGRPASTPTPEPTLAGHATQAPQAAEGEVRAGERVGPEGRYRLHEELGRGGMGIVFRATDGLMEEQVAVKVMLPALLQSASARRRFRSEATLARKLTHPNIVRVHGADSHGDQHLLVMELLQGSTLRELLGHLKSRGRTMAPTRVLEIARQCCEALATAHDAGVLHRDIKPDNIFLEQVASGSPHVKLLDFGIARVLEGEQGLAETQGRWSAGYVAPEVLSGAGSSERSDLFSLGVVLYECLTGELPLGRFRLPGELGDGSDLAWDDLLELLLAASPADRPTDAREVLALLDATGRTAPSDRPATVRAATEKTAGPKAPGPSRGTTAPGPPGIGPTPKSSVPAAGNEGVERRDADSPRRLVSWWLVGALCVLVASPVAIPIGIGVWRGLMLDAQEAAPSPRPVKELPRPSAESFERAWETKLGQAIDHFCVEEYAKAIAIFDELQSTTPGDPRPDEYIGCIYYNLAVIELQALRPWDAIWPLEQALKRVPDDTEALELKTFAEQFPRGTQLIGNYAYTNVVDPVVFRKPGCD